LVDFYAFLSRFFCYPALDPRFHEVDPDWDPAK